MNKSHVRFYWIVWIFLIIVFFIGKIFNIYLLQEIRFFHFFFIIFVVLGLIDFIYGIKFKNYIKLNHKEKWDELNCIPFLGLKGTNNIREIKFIFSSEYFNDMNLLKLKDARKSLIKLEIVHFLSIPISFFLLIILHMNKIITWPF